MATEIDVPAHGWLPRPYQRKAWAALERGIKRAVLIWPRRGGKDDLAAHWTVTQTVERPGTYWHMMPEYAHARRAVWNAVDPKTGRKRISNWFPEALIKRQSNDEMLIETHTGSVWQMVGSDQYNALVGAPPRGVVFSEYALAKPEAWDFIRPILAENGGWAIFVTTPRGQNHAYKMFHQFSGNPDWFVERLTAEQTQHIPADVLAKERDEMPANRYRQEYECDFNAANDDALISTDLAQSAMGRGVSPIAVKPIWGLDPARFGPDRSALCVRRGNIVEHIEARQGLDVMQVAAWVAERFRNVAERDRPSHVVVDSIGIGAGVADALRSLSLAGVRVVDLNVGESPSNASRFRRKRDELMWSVREWLEARNCRLPDAPQLIAELTAPTYGPTLSGLIKIERKEDTKARLGVSPDLADALMLTFAVAPVSEGASGDVFTRPLNMSGRRERAY